MLGTANHWTLRGRFAVWLRRTGNSRRRTRPGVNARTVDAGTRPGVQAYSMPGRYEQTRKFN